MSRTDEAQVNAHPARCALQKPSPLGVVRARKTVRWVRSARKTGRWVLSARKLSRWLNFSEERAGRPRVVFSEDGPAGPG